MKKIVSAALLAAAFAASPALAQDNAFAGGRAELFSGYDNVEGDEGLLYGVAAGYDVAIGQGLIGFEAEVGDSTVREIATDVFTTGDTLKISAGRDLYVGGRLGFAAGPRTLIFAKGGFVNGAVAVRYDDGTTVETARPKGDGYRVGAGIEQQLGLLGPKSYVRAEYRYSNYGSIDYAGTGVAANVDRHQVLVGLGVRF